MHLKRLCNDILPKFVTLFTNFADEVSNLSVNGSLSKDVKIATEMKTGKWRETLIRDEDLQGGD